MAEILPSLLGLTVPNTPLLTPLLSYLRKHTSPSTVNHSIRSGYWSLLLCSRLPQYTSAPPGAVNHELVFLACIMHDFGWAITREILSDDKRFEVDGASLAVKFVEDNKDVLNAEQARMWSAHQLESLWATIALHTAPSIALHHPRPEVGLVHLGILVDFLGPNMMPPFPPDLLTKEEYLDVINHFPREGFKDEVIQIFCGLCREKPETTLDNWQKDYGLTFGLDTNGGGIEEFKKKVEAAALVPMIMGALDACTQIEPKEALSKPREKREKYWYEAE